MQQVDNGWLAKPVTLDPNGKPDGFTGDFYNIPFRIGVFQADKLRASGDLRRILTNEDCAVLSPYSSFLGATSLSFAARRARMGATGGFSKPIARRLANSYLRSWPTRRPLL